VTSIEIAPAIWMTLQEVSRILYVDPRVVGQYVAEKGLKASKIGKRLLIKRSDLDSFIESRAVSSK
jgi:excisionase family DNA binding protein